MENNQKPNTKVDQTIAQFIDAGFGLVMLPFTLIQQTIESTKETTSARFEDLQARGAKLEAEIKEKLEPAKQSFSVGSIFSQMSSMISPKANRDAKVEELSKKVDTLVELVATLAAKKAAEAETAKGEKAAPKPRRRTSTASKSTAAKSTTTRKRTTTKSATTAKATKGKAE